MNSITDHYFEVSVVLIQCHANSIDFTVFERFRGTFKYHMTLRVGGGVCSNCQSTVVWGRGEFGQIVV